MEPGVAVRVGVLILAAVCLAHADLRPGPGVVRLYYQTEWTSPHIHYNPDSTSWTPVPGVPMVPSDNTSFPGWMFTVAANQLMFVLNDGNGRWDDNHGKNYLAQTPGVFSLVAFAGEITTIDSFPKSCPGNCNDHGKCDLGTLKCSCSDGWSGPACTCSPGLCGDHGECNAVGKCVCAAPWAACSGESCSVDTSVNPDHCGACNKACHITTGVKSAQCSNSTCHIECNTGYIRCPDPGTGIDWCQQGIKCPIPPLPTCQIFTDNRCPDRDAIDTDPKYANREWFTPRPGDADYREDFGDYWRLVGHSHVEYDSLRTTALVSIVAKHIDKTAVLTYEFDGETQTPNTRKFVAPYPGPVKVRIISSDGAVLQLQDVDLWWSAPLVDRKDGDYRSGQKGAIVEMFGWPHREIEAECASLSKMGWAGVKVFPMQEQVMSLQPFNDIMNPWYFMYQPVSYRFEGRMGNAADLRSMITTCRKFGVRVYADAVINHMVGSGNDVNPHHRNSNGGCVYWPNKNSSAEKVSPFYTQGFTFTYNDHTGQPPLQEFPAVPYGPLDFHCEKALDSWTSPVIMDSGWLTGLVDLHTGRENVRERIADYLTSILSVGFSGFRIDAAKHIKPDDLVAILSKVRRNMGGEFPADFITWLEILLGGESFMLLCNTSSGYNYGADFEAKMRDAKWTDEDILKVKIWFSGYPKEPQVDCGKISRLREAIQNDDADQQNPGSTSREMFEYGSVLIKEKDVAKHRKFEVKLFTDPNGAKDPDNDYPIRLLLSSYYWADGDKGMGVPDGLSDCSLCQYTCTGCHGMPYTKAYDPDSCGYDAPVYTRTHRDKTVINAMRAWMHMSANLSNTEIGIPEKCT